MTLHRSQDIVLELVELAQDLLVDIAQQLNYYRASVYKQETSKHIKNKVENLRMIVNLINDDDMLEVFRDHDAMQQNLNINYAPGECSFSTRTTRLVSSLSSILSDYVDQPVFYANAGNNSRDFVNRIKKHRKQLISMCRYGSRSWSLFQSL